MTAITLADLTPFQRAAIANGCGAKSGWRRWIRPPQGHARVHCDQHDLDCVIGGDRSDEIAAAKRLLRGLLSDAPSRPWWQRPGFRAKAWIYYAAIRLLGAGFHRGRQRTMQDLARMFPPAYLHLVESPSPAETA
jgi:hypothetical protein